MFPWRYKNKQFWNASNEYSQHVKMLRNKSLQIHAYSNTVKILPPKMAIFQIKNSDIFHISAQNIDCGYSLELPH